MKALRQCALQVYAVSIIDIAAQAKLAAGLIGSLRKWWLMAEALKGGD
jgi:hypothetical protein